GSGSGRNSTRSLRWRLGGPPRGSQAGARPPWVPGNDVPDHGCDRQPRRLLVGRALGDDPAAGNFAGRPGNGDRRFHAPLATRSGSPRSGHSDGKRQLVDSRGTPPRPLETVAAALRSRTTATS